MEARKDTTLQLGSKYSFQSLTDITAFGRKVYTELLQPELEKLHMSVYKTGSGYDPLDLILKKIPSTLHGKVSNLAAELVHPEIIKVPKRYQDRIIESCTASYVIEGNINPTGRQVQLLKMGLTHFAMRRLNGATDSVSVVICGWSIETSTLEQTLEIARKNAFIRSNNRSQSYAPNDVSKR